MNKLAQERVAIVIISGSAGELDWILPILDLLKYKKFKIKIIFLSRHALKSVKENITCNEFINQKNNRIDVTALGGYFFEKIEQIGYVTYRAFLKLELSKIPIIKSLFKFYFLALRKLFLKKLPLEITNSKESKFLFFSEFPSLRRPRDIWIKEMFSNSIFFYNPHSPHIYAEDLDQKYEEPETNNFKKKSFLLLGHPGDFHEINDGKELASPDLEKLFIGHPKYSHDWLTNLKDQSRFFREKRKTRDKIIIVVLSRGYGSFMDEYSHKQMITETIEIIEKLIPNYHLLVKKHPREIPSYWDLVLQDNPAIKVVTDHIFQLAAKADFVISFWGSGAMDCISLETPVIEYWNPNNNSKGQVPVGDGYTTIYRKLGIVLPANNKEELMKRMASLIKNNFELTSTDYHPFFNELVNRSNNWKTKIENVLENHNLTSQ